MVRSQCAGMTTSSKSGGVTTRTTTIPARDWRTAPSIWTDTIDSRGRMLESVGPSHDNTGPLTHSMFQAALKAARRVAGETAIHQRRVSIPSVAVADFMTSVYPLAMPGGWHIIGRCPIPLFTPEDQDNPTLLRGGDLVRFTPIKKDKFDELKARWHK